MFAPFAVRDFRFQWGADLLTSWAFEMETIILGWYILVETRSVLLLTLFASLQFVGTLIAPLFGLAGDRAGPRNVLLAMRLSYAVLAAAMMALAVSGSLTPAVVLILAGLAGLARPSDLGLRNVLIGAILPQDRLMGAIGLARLTTDSARVVGALVGAGAMQIVGMGSAYVIVVLFYLASATLMLGIRHRNPVVDRDAPVSPWRDMVEAGRAVWNAPPQLAAMSLAFLVNLTAYPFTLGLLPYLARAVYDSGETVLGYLSASVGIGAIAAALLLTRLGATVWPARMMITFSVLWHMLIVALGWDIERASRNDAARPERGGLDAVPASDVRTPAAGVAAGAARAHHGHPHPGGLRFAAGAAALGSRDRDLRLSRHRHTLRTERHGCDPADPPAMAERALDPRRRRQPGVIPGEGRSSFEAGRRDSAVKP